MEAAAPSATGGPATSPSGSATGYRGFLFCDLRGYTRYVERHGDQAAADLLDRYRDLVRDAVGQFDGAEIRTEGDSFYVVFPGASRAVLCGLAIADGARTANAADPALPIHVALGVHAGEAIERPDGFVGQAVNIAARVCAQAQAGEVLVTDTVRGLIRTSVAARFEPRGRRQLKGIDEPVFLFAAFGPDTASRRFRRWPTFPLPVSTVLRIIVVGVAVLALAAIALPSLTGRSGQPQASVTPAAGAAAPSAAPRSGVIAFVDRRTASIWVIRDDGADRRRVPVDEPASSAAISPDGRRIVFVRTAPGGGPGRIEVVNLDGEGWIPLTDDPRYDDRAPAWSPDGLAVVFARMPVDGGLGSLWVVNVDGSQLEQITAPESESHDQPSWSPDGSRIGFTTFGGTVATGVISTDCSGYRSFGPFAAEDYGPVWAPDASRIAFTGLPDATAASEIFAMSGAGRDAINLTNHPSSDSDPAWSPDGHRIAFVSRRSGDDEIWIMGADGSEPRRITRDTGSAFTRLTWAQGSDEASPAGTEPSAAGVGPSLLPPALSRPTSAACPAQTP